MVVSRKAKRRKFDTKLTCEGVISIPPESSVVAPKHAWHIDLTYGVHGEHHTEEDQHALYEVKFHILFLIFELRDYFVNK